MMNLMCKQTMTAVIIGMTVFSSSAQWVPTNGPYGGGIYSFAVCGTTICACAFENNYMSNDGGSTWKRSTIGSYGSRVIHIVNDSSMLTSTYDNLLLRSNDRGNTWTLIDSGLEIISFAAHGDTFYAGTRNPDECILRSVDNGVTWTPINANLTDVEVNAIVVADAVLFAGISAGGGGVWRSMDNGTSWSPCVMGLEVGIITALAIIDSTIVAGTDGEGILYSTDSGASWDTAAGPERSSITCLTVHDGLIFAGALFTGIFLSSDKGKTWAVTDSGLSNNDILCLAAVGNTLLAGTSDYGPGVFRSGDNGKTWSISNSGICGSMIFTLGSDTNALLAGGYDRTMLRSADFGATWATVAHLDTGESVSAFASGNNAILGATNKGSVYRSTDGGISWSIAKHGGTGSLFELSTNIVGIAVIGASIIAAEPNDILVSTDNGSGWTATTTAFGNRTVKCLQAYDSLLFAGTYEDGISRSGDTGRTWTQLGTGLNGKSVLSIALCGGNLYAGTYNSGIFRSADNGATWERVRKSDYMVTSFAVSDDKIFAGINYEGVLVCTNGTTVWNDFNAGLPNKNVWDLAVCGDQLFTCISNQAVWRRPLAETGVMQYTKKQRSVSKTAEFKVDPPSVTNRTLGISCMLPVPERVTITLYHMSGQVTSTIVDRILPPGRHVFKWPANRLAAGCYIMRLQAGADIQMKRIPVIR